MMLQGHFIDTLLDESHRDTGHIAFKTWEYFRGITAPTFFTISGLIFSYLLIKAKHSGNEAMRIRKGLLRGLMLIGIGYLLRIPIFEWIFGKFNSYFLVIDVLQCIGLSLITIVIIYRLTFKKTLLFSLLMFFLGLVIFISEPLFRNVELPNTPLVISNYFSKVNGSIFNIIPWFGYVAFGSFISTLFYKYLKHPRFKVIIISSFLVIGGLLITQSSFLLIQIYSVTDCELIKEVAYYNFLFTRLGNVLILFALFYSAEKYIKQPIVLKIGQKTLSIYVIHFIILYGSFSVYGSFSGIGLQQLIGKTLTPWQAILGAILFLSSICFIAFHYTKTNEFIYGVIRALRDMFKRVVRYLP